MLAATSRRCDREGKSRWSPPLSSCLGPSRPASRGSLKKTSLPQLVLPLPLGAFEISMRLVPADPTVMWRMRRPDGLLSHAVIAPRPGGAVVEWFVNGRPLGSRDFG